MIVEEIMKNLLLAIVALSGCVGQIFSSEKNDKEIVLRARMNDYRLHYFLFEHSQFYRNGTQKHNLYGHPKYYNLTLQKPNEPSIRVEYVCDFSESQYWDMRACLVLSNINLADTLPLWVRRTSNVCNFFKIYHPPVPLHHLLLKDDQNFKKKGDELFSFTDDCAGEKIKFIITLDSDITQTLEDIINVSSI